MCGSLVGELLPFRLVYGGKTNRCHPTYKFPADWQIVKLITTGPMNRQWSSISMRSLYLLMTRNMKTWVWMMIIRAALAILDHFKGQLTDETRRCLEDNHIRSIIVPAAYTGKLQPMDILVNKVVKSFLRSKFSEWYSDKLTELFIEDDDEPVESVNCQDDVCEWQVDYAVVDMRT